jgi:radical SAM superfamily enzyme YgiQ (UPF0313 family)
MKITFVIAVDKKIEKTQMFGIRYMPVWAYTLAASLRELQDIEIDILDSRIYDVNASYESDIFLFSGINQDSDAIVEYQKNLKSLFPKALFIIGGPITSSFKLVDRLGFLDSFDHIVIGEGEEELKIMISGLRKGIKLPKQIEVKNRFPIVKSRPLDFALLSKTFHHYYGGVIEVSRGCPFLCEFCDIRTMKDNNRANNKPVSVILEDLEQFRKLGITNILFACDNFIGDPAWATELCDAIISWKSKNGFFPSFYTWLTINLSNHPVLLEKLRHAGFEMFFIGIESFGEAQLLETAKIQNTKVDIKKAVETIQSYGFIVVAGLIFGFDTDDDKVVNTALDGIKNSGIISGDPSLLTALPGTPLYRRMQKSNRLRDGKLGLGGAKYRTNILYLKPKEKMLEDFFHFVNVFNSAKFQFDRYQVFLNILSGKNFIPKKSKGYVQIGTLVKLSLRNLSNISSIAKRFFVLFNHPTKVFYIIKAYWATKKNPNAQINYFYFWLFNWSNSIIKYADVKSSDFDIDSVSSNYEIKKIVPEDYVIDFFEPIPKTKIKSQRKLTIESLSKVIKAYEK